MKRRVLLALSLTLLLMLVVLPVLVLGTELGARGVFYLTSQRLPLAVTGVQGSLWRGLQLSELRFQEDGVDVWGRGLTLVIDWRCAWNSVICVRSAAARSVDVTLTPPADARQADEPFSLEDLPWPLPLAIERLDIDRLAVIGEELRQEVSTIAFAMEPDINAVTIGTLSGSYEGIHWTGQGRLARSGTGRLALNIRVDQERRSSLPIEVPERYSVQLDGDSSSLSMQLSSDQLHELSLHATVSLPTETSGLKAMIDIEGLNRLLAELSENPWARFTGTTSLSGQLADSGWRVRVSQPLLGYGPESAELSIALDQRGDEWYLASAALHAAGKTRVSATGSLGEVDSWSPDLKIRLDGFATPEGMEPRIVDAQGGFHLSSPKLPSLDAWSVQDATIAAVVDDRAFRMTGALRAGNGPFLPHGEVRIAIDDYTFDYQRADEEDAPVALRFPQGLIAGGVHLDRAEIDLRPGTPTAITAMIDGDVATRLVASLDAAPGGASIVLEPFDISVGQHLIGVAAVAAHYDSSISRLALEPFCVTWRASRACSQESSLGASGELALKLTGNDRYSGMFADKPFSVEARGSGTLRARWEDLELRDARAQLTLDQLLLDPFVGAQTAESVSWEAVSIDARYVADRVSLAADLDSRQAGRLQLRLGEGEDSLDGELALEAFDLRVLDDFLPEWRLHSGAIDGALTLAGTRQQPVLNGDLRLSDGSVTVSSMETTLSEIQLQAVVDRGALAVDGSAALGGGPVGVTGTCCDDGEFRARLVGERNQLQLPIGLDATVSPAINLRLNTERMHLAGLVEVHEGVLEHGGPVADGIDLSDDIERIDRVTERPRRFDLSAEIQALIDPVFSVRSRELEATVGGDLRLAIDPGRPPELYGNLQVRGGELKAFGQVLRLTDGGVGFVGDPLNPDLNLSAEREFSSEQLRVGFRVTGNLDEPLFQLYSDPPQPERDTLSYLLRGRGPDAGASADGTAMALSLGASALNQTGLLRSLNEIPGLSDVSIGAEGSDEQTSATISAYVGKRLYLSYGIGIYEPVNALTARLYLRSRLWLEVISSLESSFDLYYRFDRN